MMPCVASVGLLRIVKIVICLDNMLEKPTMGFGFRFMLETTELLKIIIRVQDNFRNSSHVMSVTSSRNPHFPLWKKKNKIDDRH
jgi:hypothetical protein